MSKYPYHYPINNIAEMLDAIDEGATRIDHFDDRFKIKVYKVGKFVRIDIIPTEKEIV